MYLPRSGRRRTPSGFRKRQTPESVSEGDADLPNDNSTPGRVAVGGSATGSPGGGGTLADTYFRAIYDSAGEYQPDSYNDDFDGGRDSRVTFTPSEGGTYYARVSGDRDETGTRPGRDRELHAKRDRRDATAGGVGPGSARDGA